MENFIFELLRGYTYEPYTVYSIVVLVMILSSLGLPLPEEVSIISLGVLSYIGEQVEIFPPPFEGAPHVEVVPAMIVCSLSIFLSDVVIYTIGRKFGPSIFKSTWFQRLVPDKRLTIVKKWARKWGRIVPGLFRMMPGVRFPGHLLCGALGIKRSIFFLVDGLVVLLMVPTQIFLISLYGEEIISLMERFQFILVTICGLIFAGLIWNFYKLLTQKD